VIVCGPSVIPVTENGLEHGVSTPESSEHVDRSAKVYVNAKVADADAVSDGTAGTLADVIVIVGGPVTSDATEWTVALPTPASIVRTCAYQVPTPTFCTMAA
jgi:hypothetical protein